METAVETTRVGRFRWTICGLLFLAATINYVDRQVIGILKPTLQAEFGWSEIDYGDIVFAFQLAYAIGFLFAGRIIDRLGTRKVLARADRLVAGGDGHAEATRFGPGVAFVLGGFGLSAPRRSPASCSSASCSASASRAISGGDQDGGRMVSTARARVRDRAVQRRHQHRRGDHADDRAVHHREPRLVLGVRAHRPARLRLARPLVDALRAPVGHPRLGASELAHITSDPPESKVHVPWAKLVGYRQTWTFAVAKFMTDPTIGVLFWMPDFFGRNYGLSLLELGPPLIIIYLLADVGSVGGGWLVDADSARLVGERGAEDGNAGVRGRRGADRVRVAGAKRVERRRAAQPGDAAHQGWSANAFTLASDMFPRQAVASVVGWAGLPARSAGC